MVSKLDKEFTDRPSYSSIGAPTNEDRWNAREELDRTVDDWQQSEFIDQIGYNLDY